MQQNLLIPAAVAALALFSCQSKQELPTLPEGSPVEVTVCLHDPAATRVTGVTSENESKVNNLQVLVFNDGKLEDYKSVGNAMTATINATAGERTVWAVVNAGSLASIQTEQDLLATVSDLSENAKDSFVMTGSTTATLSDKGTVFIDVYRLVSRVSINKITNAYQYSLAQKTLKVTGIYLINVAAGIPLEGVGNPTKWVNKLRHEDSGYDGLLYDGLNETVANGKSYEKEHVFYPYPNPTVKDEYTGEWSERHTLLVVEVTLDGKTGYYPIVLPELERNKRYIVEELVLTRNPGNDPYIPIETGAATVTITVKPWDNGYNFGTVNL